MQAQKNNLKNNQEQYLPKPYKRKNFYTPNDVAVHNIANDCWVTFFHQVFDITKLIQENIESPLTKPLIEAAGTDITYWFDNQTKEPRKYIDIETGLEAYYCPKGRYLHIPPIGPDSFDTADIKTPWWKDDPEYCIGRLTIKTRKIKIINMLADTQDIIEVPCEEKISEILERYKEFNDHAASYTWKRLGRPLDMDKTLEENNICEETEEFEKLGIPESEWYIPAIHLYFNDDLTIA